jgi:hypothetical protein
LLAKGDLDGDGDVDLADAVLGLQLSGGGEPASTVYEAAFVGADGRLDYGDVLYVFQKCLGLR